MIVYSPNLCYAIAIFNVAKTEDSTENAIFF